MIIDWSNAIQQARLIGFRNRLDAGATPGKLAIYTAPKPTPGDALTTQVLLGRVILLKPCGIIADNTFTFFQPANVIVLASGQPAWGRFSDGDDFWVGDAAVGLVDSGTLLQTDRLEWFQGSIIGMTLGTLTETP